jgi:hypothetical protein
MGHPRVPIEVPRGRHALGLGGYLATFKLARVLVTLSDMSDSYLLQSFNSNSTFIMLYRYHEMDVDYLVADKMININADWSHSYV